MANVQKWAISEYEIGYYAPEHGSAQVSELKVQIPKITPLIFSDKNAQSMQDNLPRCLNSSCFCNASACKPKSSSIIRAKNYLTVPMMPGQTFSKDHFYRGDTLKIRVENDNIYSMYVTNLIDESHSIEDCEKEVSE